MTAVARVVRTVAVRHRWAAIVATIAVGAVPHPRLSAQGTQPLHKTDMIRLLTVGGLSTREIADLVRRNCLAFQPTARDRTDLRVAGADAAVLGAVDGCVHRRAGGGGGGGGGGAGGGARDVLRVVAEPKVSAPAGTEATLTARLLQGKTPRQRVPLTLKGTGAIPGGLTQDAVAFTDAQGAASFHVPAGTKVGTYRLTVAQLNGAPVRGGEIELTTTPARELVATVMPSELLLAEGAPGGGVVRVTVADVYGNPAAGLPLQLGPVTAALTAAQAPRTTDERGQVAFPITHAVVRREGQIGVFSGEARLGLFTVRVRPLVLSEGRTRFVVGAEQRGPVATPLAQPLVFEVRDTTGAPVPGQSVALSATGGTVTPAVSLTDSTGSVRMRVTLGERAGPVVVAAKVGNLNRSATVYAEPGVASELLVLRDSAVVKGSLALLTRKPALLHVVARDRYGNETALANFTAVATGPAIRLKGATVSGSQGVVTLEPRSRGSGDLVLRAAQLEARVPVQVAFPVGAGAGGWVLGARGSWAGFTYEFPQLRSIRGRPGVRGELFAGRAVTSQLRLELVAGLGSLSADTGTVTRSVALTQGYLRGEYALTRAASVTPVVSLGGGLFRIRSDDPRHIVYHSSVFWLAGLGVDATLGPRVTGELRLETQQLNEMTSSIVNGHVGALTIVEAGIRFSP
jgi:hypothetical protein